MPFKVKEDTDPEDYGGVNPARSVRIPCPPIVCLCGSTRFSAAFRQANLNETLKGFIVLSIGCDMRTDGELFAGKSPTFVKSIKAKLDDLHMRKIELADQVLILNVGGYIGQSTQRELDYALSLHKIVRYLEDTKPIRTCLDCGTIIEREETGRRYPVRCVNCRQPRVYRSRVRKKA